MDRFFIRNTIFTINNSIYNFLDIVESTQNWWSAFAFYLHFKNQVLIRFRSSSFTIYLSKNNKNDYYCLREMTLNRQLLPKGYALSQQQDGHFRFKGDKFDIITNPTGILLLSTAASDLSIENIRQLGSDLFEVECKKYTLYGSIAILTVLRDLSLGTFDCDFQNKIVLDIGGFQGETAVIFSTMGAKKVIVYEPMIVHQELIRKNLAKNNVVAEVHPEGIADKNCAVLVRFAEADMNLGVNGEGSNIVQIKLRSMTEILVDSQANMAKIDCEGSELCLTTVPNDVLQMLDYFIIETHSHFIRETIIKKFLHADFKLTKNLSYANDSQISVLHFAKNPKSMGSKPLLK